MKTMITSTRLNQAIVCTAILAGATLSSCSNLEDALEAPANATLDINVSMDDALTRTATPVSGTSFSGAASLGVSLYKANKTALYATSGASNVEYKTTNGSTWTATSPISINNTEGVVTAYYPYASGTTITAIPMKTSDNKDWMYQPFSTETYSVASHQADIHLAHAQAIITIKVYTTATASDAYTGVGLISSLNIASDGFTTSSLLDATTGTITGTPGAISIANLNKKIGTSYEATTPQDKWFVSPLAENNTSDIFIKATIDGINYQTIVSTKIQRGHNYTLKLCLKNTGLSAQQVSISQWVNETITTVGNLTPIIDGGIHNGHEYVDLGMTRYDGKKVYWATCNVGASKPEELGGSFIWGATTPGGSRAFTPSQAYETDDELLSAHDAAYQAWGGNWRMPADIELDFLWPTCKTLCLSPNRKESI